MFENQPSLALSLGIFLPLYFGLGLSSGTMVSLLYHRSCLRQSEMESCRKTFLLFFFLAFCLGPFGLFLLQKIRRFSEKKIREFCRGKQDLNRLIRQIKEHNPDVGEIEVLS